MYRQQEFSLAPYFKRFDGEFKRFVPTFLWTRAGPSSSMAAFVSEK
jgi:hypothetical protein